MVGLKMLIPNLQPDIAEAFEEVISYFPQAAQSRALNKSYYSHLFFLSKIKELMPNLEDKHVLDVGAGGGLEALTVKKLGATVTAVDTWTEYDEEEDNPIGRVSDIIARYDSAEIARHECDIMTSSLPFSDNNFDMVLFSNVLEHLHGSPKFPLTEMVRVLRPGGILLLAVPNIANLRWRINLLFGRSPLGSLDAWYFSDPFHGHIREYTPAEVETMVRWLDLTLIGTWPNDGLIWNTKVPTKEYALYERSLKFTSLFQLAKIPYFALTALIPNLRYGIVTAGSKQKAVKET